MDSTPAKAPPPNRFADKFFWQKGSCGSEETYLYYQVTEQSTEQITGGIAGRATRPLLISPPHAILFDTPVTGMPPQAPRPCVDQICKVIFDGLPQFLTSKYKSTKAKAKDAIRHSPGAKSPLVNSAATPKIAAYK